MSYVERTLLGDEQIKGRAKLHWIFFKTAIFAFAFGIGALVAGGDGLRILGALLLVGGAFVGAVDLILYSTFEFAVTNKRVVGKMGLIRRTSLEVLLDKVEGIIVDQSILGRLLGYGTIIITTGGPQVPFPNVADPLAIRQAVQMQIEASKRR
ncbi:MAG: PH domain-containing protein [Deltaproteobacteria bacterium]|nr:PH domain-containing protein [Deltaproteobacteria bacterium]